MKTKVKQECHGMSAAELKKKASELKKQIRTDQQTMMTKEVKNRRGVKELKKKLAILLSIARMKELIEGK